MPDYIPQDWPNQKAKIPTGFLSKDQIMGPFTAMASAMKQLGAGISSLGKKGGGGGEQGPDDEQLKEYATQVGESQVPGSLDPLGGPTPQGKDTGDISASQPTVPQPTVSTAATGEDVVNRGGGNPFHDDNRLGEAQGSNRAAVQQGQTPLPVPRPATAPLTAPQEPGSQPQQPTPTIQAVFPPSPGSPYPSDQAGLFAGYGKKAKMMESWARNAALGKVKPGLETGVLQDRLDSAGDPVKFRNSVLARTNSIINGDPDNGVPGVRDPVLQNGIRDAVAGYYNSNLQGMLKDMDAKTARDHYLGATDTIKSNAAKIDNLAYQGGAWINPKTGAVEMSKEVQGMLLDNNTLRQSLVSDKRQNYPLATAQAETQAQAASMVKEAVIGQVSRNFQKDWDRPSAEKALKEAFTGPGSERYNFTAAQRAAAVNEGMTSLDNFDTRNKAAIKEVDEAANKITTMWMAGEGKPDPMLYNKMIQQARAVNAVDTANRMERNRPLISWAQSMAGAPPAQRDQAQRELMHASLAAGGVGSFSMRGASPEARQFFTSRGGGGLADEAHFSRLNPEFTGRAQAAIQMAEQATGAKVHFNSFGRSTEEQAKLYAEYKSGGGGLAAPPGHSRHEVGNAVDIARGPVLDWLHQHKDEVAQRFGVEFLRPGHGFEQDPVHLQLAGSPNGGGTIAHMGGPAEQQMSAIATKFGYNPDDVRKYIAIESGGNARNQTGSYKGLLQLSDSEFNRYKTRPGADIWNPQDNLEAGLRKMRAEGAEFEARTGQKATPFDLYMVHQRGLGGYVNAIKDPNGPAFMSMLNTSEGKSKGVEWAKKTIWMNPPSKDFNDRGRAATWTNKDFVEAWRAKFDGTKGGGYTPATSPVFSAGHRPTDFGGGDVRPKEPAPLSLPSGGRGAVPGPAAAPSSLAPPSDLFVQSPSGFAQAYAESMRIAREQASRSVSDLEKLQEKGYPVKIEDVDRAAELAQYGGNREAHDKLEMLHTALDIKNGIPPGTTHAQRSAAFEDAISNADNPHLAAAALQAKEGIDASNKMMQHDPLAWGASANQTNKLGDVLDDPLTQLSRRAVDIPRLQAKEPDLGAISAVRPDEGAQVARMLTTGDPKQAQAFLTTAQQALGGPNNETYRATMAQPEIKQALVAMAGNPDPARMGAAMPVLDGLFRQDPNGFRSTYGETGLKRLQLWQGMQGNFPDQLIAEKIAAADDPATAKVREQNEKLAAKELGIEGGKPMNIQSVADRLYGGTFSGIPLVGSMISGGSQSLDANTAGEMAVQYSETYKQRRAEGLSADAAGEAATNSMRSRWKPSEVNNGRIMMFAPEAVTNPKTNQPYYPELTDRDTGKPSQRWIRRQLTKDLEGELGPQEGVSDPSDVGSLMSGGTGFRPGGWQLAGIVSDQRTQSEEQRGDLDRPPTYQAIILRNGKYEVVTGPDNRPKRFSFDTKKEKAEIAADQGYGRRVERSQQRQLNALTQPTGPM